MPCRVDLFDCSKCGRNGIYSSEACRYCGWANQGNEPPPSDWMNKEEQAQKEKKDFKDLRKLHSDTEAALCAVLGYLEANEQLEQLKTNVDWKEAGVSYGFVRSWWKKHQKVDAKRKK